MVGRQTNQSFQLHLLDSPCSLMDVRHRSLTGEVICVRSPQASGVWRFVGLDIHLQLHQGSGKPVQFHVSKSTSDKGRYAKKFSFSFILLKDIKGLIITIAKLYLGCAWLIPLNSLESNLTEHVRMWLTKWSLTRIKLSNFQNVQELWNSDNKF